MVSRLLHWLAFSPVILLGLISFLTLRSVSPPDAQAQLWFYVLGLVTMVLLARFDYHFLLFSPWPWYALTLILLLLTRFAEPIRSSTRWLNLFGFSLQTSEITKLTYLLFLVVYLGANPPRTFAELWRFSLLSLVPPLLIFFQPDLGTALIYITLYLALILAGGVSFKHLFLLLFTGSLLMPLSWSLLRPYQRERFVTFLRPQADPLGSGYNAAQATIAVGSGQFLGRGLGQGTQSHLRFLPERQTDFIFASVVEEMGLVGGTLVLFSYALICLRLLSTAQAADHDSGSLLALGVLIYFLTQTLINLGMNMSLIPVTGITLPLVSAGGSSVFAFCLLLGLGYSVSRYSYRRQPLLEIH